MHVVEMVVADAWKRTKGATPAFVDKYNSSMKVLRQSLQQYNEGCRATATISPLLKLATR